MTLPTDSERKRSPRASMVAAFLFAISFHCAANELSQDAARSIAEKVLTERGVVFSDFAEPLAQRQTSGEWTFLYKCREHRDSCQFLVGVPGEHGRVTITSEVDVPRPLGIPESIQEVVLRNEIKRGPTQVACLQIGNSGPSPSLLRKLKDAGIEAVDYAECKAIRDVRSGSIHELTGKPAMFYTLSGLKFVDEKHATLELSTYYNGLDAEGVTFFLEQNGGEWSITRRQSNWIS